MQVVSSYLPELHANSVVGRTLLFSRVLPLPGTCPRALGRSWQNYYVPEETYSISYDFTYKIWSTTTEIAPGGQKHPLIVSSNFTIIENKNDNASCHAITPTASACGIETTSTSSRVSQMPISVPRPMISPEHENKPSSTWQGKMHATLYLAQQHPQHHLTRKRCGPYKEAEIWTTLICIQETKLVSILSCE